MGRATLRCAAWLGIGAVVSTLVAWGHAVAEPARTGEGVAASDLPDSLRGSSLNTGGVWRQPTLESLPTFTPVPAEFAHDEAWTPPSVQERLAAGEVVDSWYGHSSGWPLACLRAKYNNPCTQARPCGSREYELIAGISLGRTIRTPLGETIPQALPVEPLWAGLAGNSLLFGSLAWIGWAALGLALQSHRRRLGRCPNCAYTLDGASSCPECNWSARHAPTPPSGVASPA